MRMQKKLKVLPAIAALSLSIGVAHATITTTNWSFSGTANGGTGSATMQIDINDLTNQMQITIDNTSPNQSWEPALVALGFNLDPTISWSSWSMTAYQSTSDALASVNSVIIGDSNGTGPWTLTNVFETNSGKYQGVSIDYNANNSGGVDAALYSPYSDGSYGAIGNGTPYFTTAVLTINFDELPVLAAADCGSGLGDCTTYVRMQNVGDNGTGSLKLPGSSSTSSTGSGGSGQGSSGTSIPEPGAISMIGLGLLALMFAAYRRRQSAETRV